MKRARVIFYTVPKTANNVSIMENGRLEGSGRNSHGNLQPPRLVEAVGESTSVLKRNVGLAAHSLGLSDLINELIVSEKGKESVQ